MVQSIQRQWPDTQITWVIGKIEASLLQGLEGLDWSESIKETQRNWIGKSVGATVSFQLKEHTDTIEVFTTRSHRSWRKRRLNHFHLLQSGSRI